MKRFIFNLLILAGIGQTCLANPSKWQLTKADTLNGKYEERIYKYHERWHNLIPSHTVIQYAGSVGFISTGFGWDYGKKNQWETTVMLGFLPKYNSDNRKITFTETELHPLESATKKRTIDCAATHMRTIP